MGLVVEPAHKAYNAMANETCAVGEQRDKRSEVDYWLSMNDPNEEAMKCYVALNGPLTIAMSFGVRSLTNYRSGIWDDPDKQCPLEGEAPRGNHAIVIVGYGSELSQTGVMTDYWYVQNSWSSSWGINGFFKMKRGLKLCGILNDVMYPVLKVSTPRPLKPIYEPTDCMLKDNLFSSTGVYIKSFCIDIYSRNYEDSKLNCLDRNMRLFRLDSAEANAGLFDAGNKRWTDTYTANVLHLSMDINGYQFMSNQDPYVPYRATPGNSTVGKMSVCEFINVDSEFIYSKA